MSVPGAFRAHLMHKDGGKMRIYYTKNWCKELETKCDVTVDFLGVFQVRKTLN